MSIDREQLLVEAEDLVLELDGAKEKEALIKAVAKFLDVILPLDVLIPNPVGGIAEKHDQAAFEFVLTRLSEALKLDPEKRAERRLRRKERREERRKRREAKKEDCHGRG